MARRVPQPASLQTGSDKVDPRNVMVVHGRNSEARDALYDFLRTLDLNPLEWNALVAETGGAPYIGDTLVRAFEKAQAVVVLLTPDDIARLRPELCKEADEPTETTLTGQARPNVLIEAGMALFKDERRTILVQLGRVRSASDLFGRHIIHLDDNNAECRNALAARLGAAGCAVKRDGTMWLTRGEFSLKALSPPEALSASLAHVQGIDWERIRFIVEGAWIEKATPLFENLQKAVDDIRGHSVKVVEQIDRYISQANRERLIPETNQSDLRRRLQSGDVEAVYTDTERIPKRDDKAERYRTIAGICTETRDKYNAVKAANRYLELSENSATAYQFVGYIYWWFKDIDTAIVHTERALQVAKKSRDGRQQAEVMRKMENNLAFYYAEKGVNKDEALALAERSVKDLAEGHEYYVNLMDTAGYVHLKFGTTEEDITKAIGCFDLVLDKAPQSQDTLLHLQEAWIKKRELKKQAEMEKT